MPTGGISGWVRIHPLGLLLGAPVVALSEDHPAASLQRVASSVTVVIAEHSAAHHGSMSVGTSSTWMVEHPPSLTFFAEAHSMRGHS